MKTTIEEWLKKHGLENNIAKEAIVCVPGSADEDEEECDYFYIKDLSDHIGGHMEFDADDEEKVVRFLKALDDLYSDGE